MKNKGLFAMAGLWDSWESPEGTIIDSFTILTTEANGIVKKIHDRMPVIIQQESYGRWISKMNNTGSLRQMLRPYSPYKMKSHPVNGMVNNPNNEAVGCTRRVDNIATCQ